MLLFLELLMMLPSIFNMTTDISKLFNGTATKEEWDSALKDIIVVADGIPQLKGFVVIISGMIPILDVVIPIIENSIKNKTSLHGQLGLAVAASGTSITEDDIIKAKASLRICKAIVDHTNLQIAVAEQSNQDISNSVFGNTASTI